MTQLKKAFDSAVLAAERRSFIYGFLGRINPDASVTVVHPERPQFYFVRVGGRGEPQSLTYAKNVNKVPARAHLPVRMRREGGVLVIHDVDLGYIEEALSGQGVNPFGVVEHTHARGAGLDYMIEAMRLEPGLVQWSSGLIVSVEALRYNVGAVWDTFLGSTLDLTANVPTTLGKHRWVLVALDTATNTLTTVNGADQDTGTPLTLDMLDSFTVTGLIPLAGIKIAFGDTNLSDYTKFYDARGWFNGALSLFNDTEGDPADVHNTTASDGTSTFTARRDHVHPLDEMAEATVKGVPVGGGTAKPSDLSAAQLVAVINSSGDFAEAVQDAVGGALTDSASIDFTYDDTANTITAVVLPAGVDHNALANLTVGDVHTQYVLLVGRSGGQHIRGGTAANNNLTLESTSNATKGFVLLNPSGGNVAIRNSQARYMLDIGDSAEAASFSAVAPLVYISQEAAVVVDLRNTLANIEMVFIAGSADASIGTVTGHSLRFITGNSNRGAMTSAGLFGWGRTDPVSLLHLFESNTEVGTAAGLTIEQAGAGDAIIQFLLSGVQRWVVGIDNSDSDKFKIASGVDLNSNARLTILAGGNVGVGTIAPSAKLSIQAGTSTDHANAGGTLFVTGVGAGTNSAVEQDLLTFSVPANTLATDGDSIWFEACGSFADNTNAKTVRVRFGTSGTTLVIEHPANDKNAHNWVVRGRIIRTSATTQRGYATITLTRDSDSASVTIASRNISLNQTLSNAITLRVTGQSTSTATNEVAASTLAVGWDPVNT